MSCMSNTTIIPSLSSVLSFREIPPTDNAHFCNLGTFGHSWGSEAVWSVGCCPEHAAQRIYDGELRLGPGVREQIEQYVDNPPRVNGRNQLDLEYLRKILSADSKWATKPLAQLKVALEAALNQGAPAVAEISALLRQVLGGRDTAERGDVDEATSTSPLVMSVAQ